MVVSEAAACIGGNTVRQKSATFGEDGDAQEDEEHDDPYCGLSGGLGAQREMSISPRGNSKGW